MEVISTPREVGAFMTARRSRGRAGCVVVPTMGALHAGHRALIVRAREVAQRRGLEAGCVVTIFVNPTQFNDRTDYARYPRTLEADLEACRVSGASAVLVPERDDVYPPGRTPPVPALPPQATEPRLEDAARPGHFAGVCQVVARLFDMVQPDVAVFGEKDWQQLCVVSAMVRRDRIAVEILGSSTVREPDGLAMSSRNVFLSPEDRRRALAISRSLRAAGAAPSPASAEGLLREGLQAEGIEPDYAVVRDADTLMPLAAAPGGACRMLVAAKVGPVRLLDNMPWPLAAG